MKKHKPRGAAVIDFFFGIAALVAIIQFFLVFGTAIADLF